LYSQIASLGEELEKTEKKKQDEVVQQDISKNPFYKAMLTQFQEL
jgi:hypothetical protein